MGIGCHLEEYGFGAGVCVIGYKGRMGGFHYKRLHEEHGYLEIFGCDDGDEIPDADAYIISTPSPSHYEIAKSLIVKGKHVLVEKPVALNYCEAQTLYRLAQEYDVVFMAGHTERFNPVFRRTLPGLYGKQLTYKRICEKPGTDLIFDTMIHDLELALYLNNITNIGELEITVVGAEKNAVVVDIEKLGTFITGYDQFDLGDVREIMDAETVSILNLLDVNEEKKDPLYYEHQHFLKLCERGGYNGHARFAVAAVGLAERIQEAIDGL